MGSNQKVPWIHYAVQVYDAPCLVLERDCAVTRIHLQRHFVEILTIQTVIDDVVKVEFLKQLRKMENINNEIFLTS